MNYLFYRRLNGPIFLLTFGVTALLAQWRVLSFGRSWPIYLIVYGVLRLLEGAALAASTPAAFYPTQTYPTQTYPTPAYPPPAAPGTGLATIPPAPIQPTGSTGEES